MPIEIFIELSFLISHYYFKFSQQVNFIYNNSIINLFNKIIKYQCNNEFKPSNITDITNHPLAFITLIITQNIFYQQKISEENKRFLKKLCNTKIISFRYARCILCLSYCNLKSIDSFWTEKNLLPLFNWENNEETMDLWKFIIHYSEMIYPIMPILKKSFIKCFDNFSLVNEMKEYFITVLVNSLNQKIYVSKELQKIFLEFSIENFILFITKIANKLNEETNSEDFFENIFKPLWLKDIPKHNKYLSNDLTKQLIRICFWSGKKFPEAVMLFYDWFTPIYNTYDLCIITEYLNNFKLYPNEALQLLNKVINKETEIYCKKDIVDCLSIIIESNANLEFEDSYISLKNIVE